jgi:hypothetical protein
MGRFARFAGLSVFMVFAVLLLPLSACHLLYPFSYDQVVDGRARRRASRRRARNGVGAGTIAGKNNRLKINNGCAISGWSPCR